jgi:hypothetical protein
MAGRHSKPRAHARVPEQRGSRRAITDTRVQRRPGIELVDARTRMAHQVSPEELLAGRTRGEYEALCGARLLAASLTDPGRGRCEPCRDQAAPPARGGWAALSQRSGTR